ncbi:SUKH-3 domain-containing protein [Micromonospora sp. WMMD882]|uniref:SUKH-3 domain-containing protein n=1 Tax=Micromonospora sp. WMMD882 TaxID=3015151 RepID=UPI00248AA04D|nr:SUKH-3 domain-containing protein [Micromonospora sp. WMMD882]WBB77359.1 SUKH-3 domain-containing protein [Micromonospora sp. WMMD882]
MIDRQQAEQLASVWARRDSQRLGHECVPVVEEFDVGYVISSTVAGGVPTVPGDLPTTVVDRETGEVSHWPRLPAEIVAQTYRQRRPSQRAPRTVDPAAQLLREIHRLPTPGTAAHLTVDGRTYVAQGAKGDVEVNHHPMIQGYLSSVPTGHLVRGGDRHAELVVVSDVLHEYDHQRALAGQPPLDFEEYLALLETARLEIFRVREPGDPAGGPADRPCDSCLTALVHLRLRPWADLAYVEPWRPDPQPLPDPNRFPAEVAHSLAAAGWRPEFGDELLAEAAIDETCEAVVGSAQLPRFPAALQALTAFPSLSSGRRGPGEAVWISRFQVDPLPVAHSVASLVDFGRVLGVRLFPIGTERQDSILAVDERGRIFALDQAGEWFLGPDVDAALTTLLLGRAPARVHDDGTW